jgi:hypothetical protein
MSASNLSSRLDDDNRGEDPLMVSAGVFFFHVNCVCVCVCVCVVGENIPHSFAYFC